MDILLKQGKTDLKLEVSDFYTAEVTKFGNSAKINAQKKYRGKKVIVFVLEE